MRSRSTSSRRTSPAHGARSAQYREAFLALGHYDNGSGPLFNMTALALRTVELRQRRQPAARPGHARDVGTNLAGRRRRPAAGPRHHQRRPRADLAVGRDGARCSTSTSHADWRERHDDPARLATAFSRSRTRSCGQARSALRNYLFAFIRERARQRWKEEHVSAARVVAAGTLLDPNALTIGFARRFTGYKRPELIFHNPERLVSILTAARRPVQIVFAGKAHPADETGKHHLQQVYRRAIDPMFGGRDRLRRRLRPARRALPRAGMRRVVEQPAQAARGLAAPAA